MCWFTGCENPPVTVVADVEFARCGNPDRETLASTKALNWHSAPALCAEHIADNFLCEVSAIVLTQLIFTGRMGSTYDTLRWPELWFVRLANGKEISGPMGPKPPRDKVPEIIQADTCK